MEDAKRSLAREITGRWRMPMPMLEEALLDQDLEALELIGEIFSQESLEEFSERLRETRIPEDWLPLKENRYLLRNFSLQATMTSVVDALVYQDKLGDVSKFIRQVAGIRETDPGDFILLETHLNVTAMPEDLRSQLLCLGFEPDNFHTLEPACYSHNFTLAFAPPKSARERFYYLQGLVAERGRAVAQMVQGNPDVDGFFEAEAYPSHWIKKYEVFRVPLAHEIDEFPLKPGDLLAKQLPNTAREANEIQLDINTRKVADIHLKVPTEAKEDRYPGASSSGLLQMRNHLLQCGFYEIISESGNAIYTAQFLDSRLAVEIFQEIAEYAARVNCFLDIVCEPCTAFWRKRSWTPTEERLAVVSPVLVRA